MSPTFFVDTEEFTFDGELRYRTVRISGHVWSVGGRSRTELMTLPDMLPSGTPALQHPTFSIAGHLIAASLTGTDDPENLTPVSKFTNDLQQRVENKIRKLEQPAHLTVTVTYFAEDPRIPKSFHYFLRKRHLDSNGLPVVLLDETVTQWFSTVSPVGMDAKLSLLIQQANVAVRFLDWKIEDTVNSSVGGRNLTFLKGHLPPPEHRPYAGLDWLMLTRNYNSLADETTTLNYVRAIGNGEGFTDDARALVLRANPALHKDYLASDAYSTSHNRLEGGSGGPIIESEYTLIHGGGGNAPQIDHIVPKSLGGANCLSNAQVTSARFNSTKQDTTKLFESRSEQWKEEMRQKLLKDPKLAPFMK